MARPNVVPIVPPTAPQWPRERVEAIRTANAVTAPVYLVGVRGYYRDSMGKRGANDRGIYDDALFLVSPHAFASFNANTDPSVDRLGVASLCEGVYAYKRGMHGLNRPSAKRYPALVQASSVTVRRDGASAPVVGWFGINIHRGSVNSTSSLGCQTIFPGQWDAFMALVTSEMRRASVQTLPYILVSAQG